MNHLNKALFEVLPTRNHTITGWSRLYKQRSAKSDLPYGVSITTNLT